MWSTFLKSPVPLWAQHFSVNTQYLYKSAVYLERAIFTFGSRHIKISLFFFSCLCRLVTWWVVSALSLRLVCPDIACSTKSFHLTFHSFVEKIPESWQNFHLTCIWPHLVTLAVQILLIFLQKMDLLLTKTPPEEIKNCVLPMVYRALEAPSVQIQVQFKGTPAALCWACFSKN